MPVILCGQPATVVDQLTATESASLTLLISAAGGDWATQQSKWEAQLPGMMLYAADVDQITPGELLDTEHLLLDLPPSSLSVPTALRLAVILAASLDAGHSLYFVGDGVSLAGAVLADGRTPALNLVRAAVILPNVQAMDDLRSVLTVAHRSGLRLLALDVAAGRRLRPQRRFGQCLRPRQCSARDLPCR